MSDREPSELGAGDIAKRLIEAAFSNDFETAKGLCTPDLVLTIEGIQTVKGHSGLHHVMEFNSDFSSDVRVEIHHVLESGDAAAINRTVHLTIAGTALTLEVGAFFTIRGGLVAEWTDYQDMQEISRALGH